MGHQKPKDVQRFHFVHKLFVAVKFKRQAKDYHEVYSLGKALFSLLVKTTPTHVW